MKFKTSYSFILKHIFIIIYSNIYIASKTAINSVCSKTQSIFSFVTEKYRLHDRSVLSDERKVFSSFSISKAVLHVYWTIVDLTTIYRIIRWTIMIVRWTDKISAHPYYASSFSDKQNIFLRIQFISFCKSIYHITYFLVSRNTWSVLYETYLLHTWTIIATISSNRLRVDYLHLSPSRAEYQLVILTDWSYIYHVFQHGFDTCLFTQCDEFK